MNVSAEAIVAAVAFLLTSGVGAIVWLVRLEGKVKQITARLNDCQSHRDRLITEDHETKKNIFEKLDELLRSVGKIEGKLEQALTKGRAK